MSHSISNCSVEISIDKSIEISIDQLNWPPEEHTPQTGRNEKRAVKTFGTTQKYAIFLLLSSRTRMSGHQISCCLVSLHFLCDIPFGHAVQVHAESQKSNLTCFLRRKLISQGTFNHGKICRHWHTPPFLNFCHNITMPGFHPTNTLWVGEIVWLKRTTERGKSCRCSVIHEKVERKFCKRCAD